jgi:hypothetical protein
MNKMEYEELFAILEVSSGKTKEELKALPPEEFAKQLVTYVNTLEPQDKKKVLGEFYKSFPKKETGSENKIDNSELENIIKKKCFQTFLATAVIGVGSLATIIMGGILYPFISNTPAPATSEIQKASNTPIIQYDPTPCMEFKKDGLRCYVFVTAKETGKTPISRIAEINPAYEQMLTETADLAIPAGSDEKKYIDLIDGLIIENNGRRIIDTKKLEELMNTFKKSEKIRRD